MKQSSTLNSGLFLYFSVTDSQWQYYTCLARCLHRKHTQFFLNNELYTYKRGQAWNAQN